MFLSSKQIKFLSIILISLSLSIIWLIRPINNHVDYRDKQFYIAHAGGEIDGYNYTNSKEAILQSINRQYKYIELDLIPNSDSILLCMHDIRSFNQMTGFGDSDVFPKDFKSRKIYNKYTPITLDEVLKIRQKRPFILVTDKIDDPVTLNKYFVKDKRNLLVEAFTWQRYTELKRFGYLPMMAFYNKNIFHYIYFCLRSKSHVKWITTSAYNYSDILKLRILKRLFGVKIAYVPQNSKEDFFKQYIGNEFDLIYF